MSLSEQVKQFDALLQRDEPVLALAPMQDVTDLPFWKVICSRGGADLYYTEYFRVHADSRLEKPILRSLTENPTGRPALAQMSVAASMRSRRRRSPRRSRRVKTKIEL